MNKYKETKKESENSQTHLNKWEWIIHIQINSITLL
jgi:hypothetical protein